MAKSVDNRKRSQIDRRTAIATLGLGSVLAIQPSGAGAGPSSSIEQYLKPVRALLLAISEGRLRAYLMDLGPTGPVVGGLEDDRGESLLTKLNGVPLTLAEGSFLVRTRERQVNVILPSAEAATNGLVGGACFSFVDHGGVLSLRTAMFGPAREDVLYHSAAMSGALQPSASAQQVQKAYDALAANGGGTLFFPAGVYRVSLLLTNRNVRIAGAGMGATILIPAAPDRPVLEGAYNSGSWSVVEIADLAIVGTGGGDGFRAGHAPRAPQDEFIGRTRFRNVRFANLGVCINRPYGQIGLWLQNCVFEGADYHLYSIGTPTPGEPMHSGNVVARDCHFSGARKAVFLMKSGVTGTGQITFDNCIMELNPGFVFYVDTMNGVDGVPGMVVRSCWNEVNATAASVKVDGAERPVYAYFKDSSLVRFEDTPVGNLKLVDSTIATQDCSLDALRFVEMDAASTLVHRQARGFGSFAPKGLVETVGASYQFLPNRALSFQMPIRTRRLPAGPDEAVLLSRQPGSIQLQGGQASLSVAAAALSKQGGVDQLIRLLPGEHVRVLPVATVRQKRWIAWIYECRLASGPPVAFSVVGSGGISAAFPIDHRTPRSVVGMSWCDAPVEDVHFELAANDAEASVVETGRFQLVEFERRQDALDYVNSQGIFVA